MEAVDIFHEPVHMKQVMRDVEPSIEDKEIDEYLEDELTQAELVLPPCPISVVRCEMVYLPQPDSGVEQQAKQ